MACGISAAALVERMGGHPATALGLPLDDASGVARWFVVALLAATRAGEVPVRDAFRALADCGLDDPRALAQAAPGAVAGPLAARGVPQPERLAALLVRASRRLAERHAGSLERLAAEAGDLTGLGGALTALAPGLGAATALRFLRPLREHWSAAREVPLAHAARMAAIHLGWIAADADAEGEPAALRAFLREGGVAAADAEAALERLGAAACTRSRARRCPLADACPVRAQAGAP